MADERWVEIPEFPGYWVSDRGRVLSRKRAAPRIMSVSKDGEGRPLVALRRGGAFATRRVHVLMLAAFVGPRPEGLVIRHLDGDCSNNLLSNLTYGTHSENGFDAVAHGTHPQASKVECIHGHPFTPENTYICPRGKRECRTCRRQAVTRADARRSQSAPPRPTRAPTERWGECERLHPESPSRIAIKRSGRRHCLECHRLRAKLARDRKAA